ncbi:MAG TPA: FAD-binding oxidoreductase [Crinalium sp.]|jgi:FAD/FMN-containing dehydrogenase
MTQLQDTVQYNPTGEPAMLSQVQQHGYEQAVEKLSSSLRGDVILPEDAAYEAERKVWNGLYNHYPAAIVRCADAEDVRIAVNFARELGMTLSVRSGGHSLPGYSSNDGGLVIDLANLKMITIDPVRRTARLEPGLTWGEVANALQPFGLAITAGDTANVGVGGLLVGGGIGWMVRAYGLTIDHLRSVEVVTADGQILRASADENPELFWGLRGGGGNFGIAIAFELDLHPGGMILGGIVFYEATEPERLLQEYVRLATAAPDELSTQALFTLAPPAPFIPPDKQGKPIVGIFVCYTGDLSEGERVLAPLRQMATPLADMIAPMPYPNIFSFTEIGTIPGMQHHGRSLLFETFSDEVLHTLVEASQAVMAPEMTVVLRVLGGAMSRVAPEATAFAHRDKQGMVLIANSAPVSVDGNSLNARTQHVFQALLPYSNSAYVNFLADEGEQGVHEAYPPATYDRLVALKNQYDPTDLFGLNQNIKPTVAATLAA